MDTRLAPIKVYHTSLSWASNGLFTRYKMRAAHAPGMPGTFYPPPRVRYPDMHHGTCVTHVPWCMPGSLTSSFLWSRWRRKYSRHYRSMRNPQCYISGKKPMEFLLVFWRKIILLFYLVKVMPVYRLPQDFVIGYTCKLPPALSNQCGVILILWHIKCAKQHISWNQKYTNQKMAPILWCILKTFNQHVYLICMDITLQPIGVTSHKITILWWWRCHMDILFLFCPIDTRKHYILSYLYQPMFDSSKINATASMRESIMFRHWT